MRQSQPKPRRDSRFRKIVRERSEGICARCGKYDAKGESDHVTPLWCGGADKLDNLQWLCRRCHGAKTVGETPLRAKADRLAARSEITRQRRAVR